MKKTLNPTPTQEAAPTTRESASITSRSLPSRFAAADVVESDEAIEVFADVPGAGEGSASVTLEGDVLTLEARPAALPEADAGATVWNEVGEGVWRREFILSDAVDRNRISATVKDGVLHLLLPKAAPARPHRIEVRAG